WNTHVLVARSEEKVLGYFRPVETTTGCDSGCSPVVFHLQYTVADKSLKLIPDPQYPLQKVSHTPWASEDIEQIQKVLGSIPSWFRSLPGPTNTTQSPAHQT